MTRLLISVRNVEEATDALAGGAALIDVKEPNRGSLGAAEPSVVADVANCVSDSAPVSAALGELVDYEFDRPMRLPCTLTYAKLGLSRCAELPDWAARWQRVVESWPAGVRAVAVVYADPKSASPSLQETLDAAIRLRCAAVLIDTFDKSQGGLLAHWSLVDVERFVIQCRAAGLLSVVAGSLDADSIRQTLPLGPEYVAVRGAACRGSRRGRISRELVAGLAELVEKNGRGQSQPMRCVDDSARRLDSPQRI